MTMVKLQQLEVIFSTIDTSAFVTKGDMEFYPLRNVAIVFDNDTPCSTASEYLPLQKGNSSIFTTINFWVLFAPKSSPANSQLQLVPF